MSLQHTLLDILADGEFHSGTGLGERLGVSRNAVWKALQQLQSLDVDIHAVHGKGYRLARPLELLDSRRIETGLSQPTREALQSLDILFDVDSTNAWLLRAANRHAVACLAERQTAGRGRRGRDWLSPFAANLLLSLGWRFELDAASLGNLGLVFGVAAVRGLRRLGVDGLGLKWPNDIYRDGRKLGGILIEMRGESGGPYELVIGLGLNVNMPREMAASVGQPCNDLHDVAGLSRNALAAAVLDELVTACLACAAGEPGDYLAQWQQLDIFAGQAVSLHLPNDRVIEGRSHGIDASGALLIEHDGQVARFSSGEVSLRGG